MENTNDNEKKKNIPPTLEQIMDGSAITQAPPPLPRELNTSGHIPCWTDYCAEPRDIDDHIDPAGAAAAGIQSAIGHLAERRIWNAVLKDNESTAQLLEDTGNLLLLMSALVRDLARR